jgi:uncharacterized repeat protein (TIGR01451 family)
MRRLWKLVVIVVLLLLCLSVPVAMAQTWPNCEWYTNCTWGCTADDVEINRLWLGYCNNGTPIGPCTAGTPVQACIWGEFHCKSTSRTQIYTLFDLYIDGQYQGSNCDCIDNLSAHTTSSRNIYGTLYWTCGQEVELKNIIVSWETTGKCNCSDPASCSGGGCKHGTSQCWGPHNITVGAPLVANFSHTAPQCYCTNINFYGKATGGSPPYSYSWDFGDGNSSTEQNTNHHYSAAGNYTVNLTVTDSGSPTNTSSSSKTVEVWQTPTANFTTNLSQIYCLPLTFNDITTGGTPPYNWSWDFDDGNGSYEQNPSHQYGAPGTYNVTLTVTDDHNCINSTTKQVNASDYTPALTITKAANVTSATVGDIIKYWYNVTNTGNVNLTSITVTDSRLWPVTLNTTFLAPGEVASGNLTYTVKQSDICANITNNATANATDPCMKLVENISANVTVTTPYTADLMITKEANVTSATVGDIIKYWYNVTNTGNVNLTNVHVIDPMFNLDETIPILAPGANQSYNRTYTVNESVICDPINNTATANATDPCERQVGPVNDSWSVSTNYTAALNITKVANTSGPVVPGDIIKYWINVTNKGNVNLTNVHVIDPMFNLDETIPILAPGANQSYNRTYTVNESVICGPINNTATANATDPCERQVGPVNDSWSVSTNYTADLSITKEANVTSATPGEIIKYWINVTNTGNASLTNVTVTDAKLGLSDIIAILAPNQTKPYALNYNVSESDICNGWINNTATANATDLCNGSVGPVNASWSVEVLYRWEAILNKQANRTAATLGDTITYWINVTFVGDPVPIHDVEISDTKFGTLDTIANLSPPWNNTYTRTYTVNESDLCNGWINNTAFLNLTFCNDTMTVNNSWMVQTGYNASLNITKSVAESEAVIGQILHYTYTVTNIGNVNLTDLTINDNRYGPVTDLTTTALAPSEIAYGFFNHTVNESDICANVTNYATASAKDPCDGTVSNVSNTVILTTNFTAALNITKEANVTSAIVGDTILYWYNVTNIGNVNLTNLVVTDSRLGDITMVPTSLKPGDVAHGTKTYIVKHSDISGPIVNNATANATDPCSQYIENVSNDVTVTVLQLGINVTKTASLNGMCPGSDPLIVHIGDIVTYCYNVTNTGNVTLTNVSITDDIYGPITLGTTILVAGASTTGKFTHVVTVSDSPSVTNTATASGTGPSGNTITDTDPCTIIIKGKIPPPSELEQPQYFKEKSAVQGTGAIFVSKTMMDKNIAVDEIISGYGNFSMDSREILNESVIEANGSNYEHNKMIQFDGQVLQGWEYYGSPGFDGGAGPSVKETFNVTEFQKIETVDMSLLVQGGDKKALNFDTMDVFEGEWGTESKWMEPCEKDIEHKQLFNGSFTVHKNLLFEQEDP